ncbi:MAG: J domain-containing protein [Aestuariivirga sp.]|uniref:J domain-containing protein n=1 Tax=Aestuariivirga sp. TaxID=2650926 RepID=UPI0038CFDE26
MTGFPDHYAVLGIDPSADQEVITAAYRVLAKKYHPDTGSTAGTASAERFEQVQQAYEVLRTPESRRRYDAELLAATERELDAHLAARQRMIAAGVRSGGVPPPSGISGIRPGPPASRPAKTRRRSLLPFLVPGLLLAAVLVGGAFLLLPQSPQVPPPVAAAPDPVPLAKTDALPPQPQSAQPRLAEAPAPPPVFGSSAQMAAAAETETPALKLQVSPEATASVTPEPPPAPAAEPVPTPKPKPKLAATPAPKKPPPKPAAPQEAELDTRMSDLDPEPRQFVTGAGPHRLVVFERQPGAKATAWSVGVFKNARRCTRFGVKAIIHRMNETGRPTPGEIWYECQPV